MFASILHSGAVRYVPWEKCGSRAAEVEMEPVDPGLKLNAEGHFVKVETKAARSTKTTF